MLKADTLDNTPDDVEAEVLVETMADTLEVVSPRHLETDWWICRPKKYPKSRMTP